MRDISRETSLDLGRAVGQQSVFKLHTLESLHGTSDSEHETVEHTRIRRCSDFFLGRFVCLCFHWRW